MSRVHSVLQAEDQICCFRSITSSGVRVLWEITSACNLRCDFCLVEIKRKPVSLDQALAIADELVERRVDKVMLSGGEPLLFKGVEHVMRRLIDGGVLVKLLTNGTVHNESVFRMVEDDASIEVSLSILSVRPDKADAIHKAAAAAKVPLRVLGRVGGDAIVLDSEPPLSLALLRTAHEGWLPHFMAHG